MINLPVLWLMLKSKGAAYRAPRDSDKLNPGIKSDHVQKRVCYRKEAAPVACYEMADYHLKGSY